MTVKCPCGQPVSDAFACSGCARGLGVQLRGVAGLVADLDHALARLAVFGQSAGRRGAELPLPFDARASEAGWTLQNTITTWARVLIEETGLPEPTLPAAGPAGTPEGVGMGRALPTSLVALWLAEHLEALRHHEAAAEAFDEIRAAIDEAWRVIDRPADRWYAGPCDACSTGLYARAGVTAVTCPGCGQPYDLQARRSYLLERARDTLATTTEICCALTSWSVRVTPDMIGGYVKRGRLERRGRNPAGRPLYRLGDVLDLLERHRGRVPA